MKYYSVNIRRNVIGYDSAIRSRGQIIRMVIGIARYLIVNAPQLADKGKVENSSENIWLQIYVDKMSRVFISEGEKIHSFYFPFKLITNEKLQIFSESGIEITSATCTILEAALYKLFKKDTITIEEVLEDYWDVAIEFDIPSEENCKYGELIAFLLSFEVGYLRFDHDPKNATEKHPCDHLDINYTEGGTYKIGLNKWLTAEELISVLDEKSNCYFLSETVGTIRSTQGRRKKALDNDKRG